MIGFNPYLTFDNTCRQALEFYKDCFNGEIESMQTAGDSQMAKNADEKDKIIHAVFKAGSIFFMASDAMGHPVSKGSNVTLNINFNSVSEQEKVFNKLSSGGNVTMPLQETFWGAKFGMVTDKFGINWMVNCELKK
jgi:PhnB protein